MRKGDRVLLGEISAGPRRAAFPDADTFVIDRNPNRHLSFGVGIHRCVGSHLARIEFAEVITRCCAAARLRDRRRRGGGVPELVDHRRVGQAAGDVHAGPAHRELVLNVKEWTGPAEWGKDEHGERRELAGHSIFTLVAPTLQAERDRAAAGAARVPDELVRLRPPGRRHACAGAGSCWSTCSGTACPPSPTCTYTMALQADLVGPSPPSSGWTGSPC